LPIIREKNKFFTIIHGQKYKVKDINALLDLGKVINGYVKDGYLQRAIRLLYKGISDITPKQIGDLIEDGNKQYLKLMKQIEEERNTKFKRSKEFLANAIKLSNANVVKGGWIVKGTSGKFYFVNKEAKVYEVEDGKQGRYICIVNKYYDGQENWINDEIANRLLHLSKDLKLVEEIHTLNPYGGEIEGGEII
jgi:hypothetical protein